jgi:hypothetical protein
MNTSLKAASKAIICLCMIALAGCASEPTTTADLMKQHAIEGEEQVALKNRLADEWEAGRKLVKTGEKRVADGEARVKAAQRDLRRAQDAIERGRREIAEGQTLVNQSEITFRENFPELAIEAAE